MNLETIWTTPDAGAGGAQSRGGAMPVELAERYGGPLEIPIHPGRPTLLVNFVSTLDGVVALGPGEERGGGVISGRFEPDRFVMALLRAAADVLVMGAGTIAGTSSTNWTAEHLQPDHAAAFARWRRDLGLAPHPTTVIVTGSGDVPLGRRGVDDPAMPVIFATAASGGRRLRDLELPPHVGIEVLGTGAAISPSELSMFLGRFGGQVVLCEGGPHLLGDLVTADVVDEYFLTIAPQVIGRDKGRLGMVEGIGLNPDEARWNELVSVKRAEDHVFLRYRRTASSDRGT
ncbi:MAG TPA: dihydrofolate reductase family protein [Candidatus Limnocylindrales bacterium]|nr:dihydrofolate reductase family protein [Candidatus Limnocylindrales bacterium]